MCCCGGQVAKAKAATKPKKAVAKKPKAAKPAAPKKVCMQGQQH